MAQAANANANEQIVLDLFPKMSAKAFDQAVAPLQEEITWSLMPGMEAARAPGRI